MTAQATAATLPAWTEEVRSARDRVSLALVADVVDAIESLNEPDLPPRVHKRLTAIIERAEQPGQGVPISLVAKLLEVSEPTVRAWVERGVLELVEGAKPRAVTPRSLGEALVAVNTIREAGRDERLLPRVIDFLEDRRVRRELAPRIDELDSRRPIDPDRVADELFA